MLKEIKPIKIARYDQLTVKVYATKEEMGQAAAQEAAAAFRTMLSQKGQPVNMVFSTGASQFAFVAALKEAGIDWQKVHAYHLDEYVGISSDHPASFRLWLRQRVDQPLQPAAFNYIEGDAADTDAECRRYEALLKANPIDIGYVGIGENGHIAFNDPPADFNDSRWVKVVELDMVCRRQQVGEGWFATIDDVPKYAISQTVPAIMSFRKIISVVPEARKAEAVRRTLTGPISPTCPASILRTHPDALLMLDADSAALIDIG
ncbi:MAG TPA: glucosamine-6-phosphate deaminase [Firmicutes bacterium]|nr:glucosamine-6-phosphate deaminase [Bacillota bacterium]